MTIKNKKAYFNYDIKDTIEAGIVLQGCEVKSIRAGHMTINESFVRIIDHEIYLVNANILPYSQGNRHNPPQNRDRKLLLHQRQIRQITAKIEQKGFFAVPTKVYFKQHRVKVEIGIGKPKKAYDKRSSIKEKDLDRQMQRKLKA